MELYSIIALLNFLKFYSTILCYVKKHYFYKNTKILNIKTDIAIYKFFGIRHLKYKKFIQYMRHLRFLESVIKVFFTEIHVIIGTKCSVKRKVKHRFARKFTSIINCRVWTHLFSSVSLTLHWPVRSSSFHHSPLSMYFYSYFS